MLSGGSITLFHVRGIRVVVDWTWFLFLFALIVGLSSTYGDQLGEDGSATTPFVLALASALGFFGSVLLHELGHAFAAKRHGIGTIGIRLWIFGGIAQLDRDSDSPRSEFDVAVGGPVVTLLLAATFYLAGSVVAGFSEFAEAFRLAIEFKTDTGVTGLTSLFSWLAMINAVLLVFNLLPAFPMDGGRVARALIWWRTGERTKSTRVAAAMGRGFGYLFMGAGLALAVSVDMFLGLWLGLIGFMVSSAARDAATQTVLTSRIDGIRVADVMDTEPVTIPGDISVEQALDEYFLRYRWPWFPVVDATHRFLGLVVRDKADEVPEVSRATSRVADLLEKDDGAYKVRDDVPLDTLLSNQNLRDFGALMAVDAEGRLCGVITVEQVGRALRDAPAGGL